jgi:hypothetical protein
MSFIIKVFANNPPTVLFALGALLILAGQENYGWNMVILGALLQIIWLLKH